MKYCGGCNPRFDRVEFVRRLREAFPHIVFMPYRPEERFGFTVIVCGCASRCVDVNIQDISGEHGGMLVCAEADFASLCERISGLPDTNRAYSGRKK